METEKISFEYLVNEATKIGDKRNKVFNALLEKIASVYIPAFVEVLKGYDLSKAYFRLNNKPRKDFDKYRDVNDESYYGICIDEDGRIHEATNEFCYEISTFKWQLCNSDWYDKEEYGLLKGAAIELAEAIKERIAELNRTYARKNERAENLLNR